MVCSLPAFSVHGDSPGKNTAVGCHILLQKHLYIHSNDRVPKPQVILVVKNVPAKAGDIRDKVLVHWLRKINLLIPESGRVGHN